MLNAGLSAAAKLSDSRSHQTLWTPVPRSEHLTLHGVRQFYINVEREERKFETLCDMYDTIDNITQSVIYCNTRRQVEWLADKMRAGNFTVSVVHNDL